MLSFLSCSKDDVPDPEVLNDYPSEAPLFTDQPPPPEYGCVCGYIITDFFLVNNSSIDEIAVEFTTGADCIGNFCTLFSGSYFEACAPPPNGCVDVWTDIPPTGPFYFNCNQPSSIPFNVRFLASPINPSCFGPDGHLDEASISFRVFCSDFGPDFFCSDYEEGQSWMSDEITLSFVWDPINQANSAETIIDLTGDCGCTPQEN